MKAKPGRTPVKRQLAKVFASLSLTLFCAVAMAWYGSATGQMITAQEEAASASVGDVNAVLNVGNQLLVKATPKRQARITAIIKASRSVSMHGDRSIRYRYSHDGYHVPGIGRGFHPLGT